jgi:hypothetical protein
VDIQVWSGLAVHAGQIPAALPAALRDAPSTVVLAYTVIATALLLGLVGLAGLAGRRQRRRRGTDSSG